jgi:pyrroline-5-carboxylate reductase
MTLSIIGTGNMAKALAIGLKEEYSLEIVGRSLEKAEKFIKEHQLNATASVMDNYDMSEKHILLCVKPYALPAMSELLKGKAATIYSILAGSSIVTLKNALQATAYVRAMPNVAAAVNYSMTTLTGDSSLEKESTRIFSNIGPTLWLNSEKELDIATGLAGSGPAYLALIAEALADGAVKQGLKRDDAAELTKGLFLGFSKLLQDMHPALLKDSVMSPGGTTAAGYAALEKGSVRSSCIDAIEEAYKKTL